MFRGKVQVHVNKHMKFNFALIPLVEKYTLFPWYTWGKIGLTWVGLFWGSLLYWIVLCVHSYNGSNHCLGYDEFLTFYGISWNLLPWLLDSGLSISNYWHLYKVSVLTKISVPPSPTTIKPQRNKQRPILLINWLAC